MSSEEEHIIMEKGLWWRSRDEALCCRYSPLFVSLASGSCLDDDDYYPYVARYSHLLNEFLKVYELALVQCVDDFNKAEFSQWSTHVREQLESNNSFIQKLGSGPIEETTPHPATVKYTELLLATASGQVGETPIQPSNIPAYTLAAVMPSLRLHSLFGKALRELVRFNDDAFHPYRKWILDADCDGFKEAKKQTKELLNMLCNSLAVEELKVVEGLYLQAMRLAMEFYYYRQSQQAQIIPVYSKLCPDERMIVFADFDFTCTNVDSLEILVNIAKSSAQKMDQQLQRQLFWITSPDLWEPQGMTSEILQENWECICQQYTSEYEDCIKEILHGKKAERIDHEGLRCAFAKLSSCEEKAVSRIFGSNILNGINLEDINQAGERMILKDGCRNFFEKVNNLDDASVNVMSCWSEDLTRSALSGLDMLKVDGNRFGITNGIYTGFLTRRAHLSLNAKLSYLEETVKEIIETEPGVKTLSICIGDSLSDLKYMLEANIGIVIGHNKDLSDVGARYGVEFIPLYNGAVRRRFRDGSPTFVWSPGYISGILYTVSSWTEIQAFLLGRDY